MSDAEEPMDYTPIGAGLRAENERLREALLSLRTYLREPHTALGEACGVDACVICLAETTVAEALNLPELPPRPSGEVLTSSEADEALAIECPACGAPVGDACVGGDESAPAEICADRVPESVRRAA